MDDSPFSGSRPPLRKENQFADNLLETDKAPRTLLSTCKDEDSSPRRSSSASSGVVPGQALDNDSLIGEKREDFGDFFREDEMLLPRQKMSNTAGKKSVESMTPREMIQLLPAEDQQQVLKVARQGRITGLFSTAAVGMWVYRSLSRRGSPIPVLGGAFLGLTLGYPLGITLTMAFHGPFLRRISQELMEGQRRVYKHRQSVSKEADNNTSSAAREKNYSGSWADSGTASQ